MEKSNRIRIRGAVQPVKPPTVDDIKIVGRHRLVPGSSREAAQDQVEVGADDVVRAELDNGFVLWTRADDLVREHGCRASSRSGEEAWEIETHPHSIEGRSGTARGVVGLGIKVLDFLGVDLKGKAASALGHKLEKRQLGGRDPGLYRVALNTPFSLESTNNSIPEKAEDEKPYLVLIHGTASSCKGSFGELWAPDAFAGQEARVTLEGVYGERTYAFEHHSLTVSPIANALHLAELLPRKANLHLVSHSRGGLVGELLCLSERDLQSDPLKTDLLSKLFAADRTVAEQVGLHPLDDASGKERDEAYKADRMALDKLRQELEKKQFKVRRFVRVACPARGTTLASGRLDRWLSVFDHLSGNALTGDAVDFLLAVVKERTDPRTLPGLEAMMPGSALTRLLHHPDLETSSDLTVIAGDVEGDSFWGRIKLFATDWFYGSDHDLVVNTGSMFGGIRRPDSGARFLSDQGPDVNHFRYFTNDKSTRWLKAGLTRTEGGDGGFQPIQGAKHEAPRWREAVRRSRAGARPRPLAVVLPGTLGSSLHASGKEIWLEYWQLLRGGLIRLRMGSPNVDATDVLDDFYGPLLEFLARSHRVEIFPYDWRHSIRDAAKKLVEKLDDWLPEAERNGQPVHLVAHSMGGLVARAMIADGAEGRAIWRRIESLSGSRLLMLGTPNRGSYETVRWLTGNNPTQQKLSLLDITQSTDEIIDIVRKFPGLVELLPFAADDPDFTQTSLWAGLKSELRANWKLVEEPVLRQAAETWKLFERDLPGAESMVYVAGCQPATVTDYSVGYWDDPFQPGSKRLDFYATREGDGTVTWKSGQLPGVKTWYLEDTAHDALCTQRRAFPGYYDLLTTGRTHRLRETPPRKARAAAGEPERFPMPATPFTDDIPDERAARSLGFGLGTPIATDTQGPGAPTIKVSIRNGDLAYASHPVLVGHYLGDTIVSAEARLDRRLDGALSRRLQLGIYPGALGTHALFFSESATAKPAGALVIGLGQVGELSPGLLEEGMRSVLLDYALQVAQWPDDRFRASHHTASKNRTNGHDSPGGVCSAALSCLLVGSGAGGMRIRDSVDAILRGAAAANSKLVDAELDNRVLIDQIEFLELFEDVAINAAEALDDVLRDGELASFAEWPQQIIDEGEGRRRRVRFTEAPGWWQRLEIAEQKDGALRFIATTDRARAEETLVAGQLSLADAFVEQASQSPSTNAEVAKTLFEMLLPNRLKEMTPQQQDLVLLVDETSARFPWELLEDRWSQTDRPISVAAGLVRQLKTPRFRPRPSHAFSRTAFVVGNPDLGGWKLFPDLPGARQEASKIVNLLASGGYRVRDSIDETADSILNGLHRDAWRILHLAGHGEHEFEAASGSGPEKVAKKVSGMVIGKETFLTPGDVEQMRWVPELVFINCCHLGKTGIGDPRRYNWLAANLSLQFIEMGVKAVVAAGWAVDDAAAHSFAESFYRHLLHGAEFGDAVRAAREEIWARFAGINTWGAYQCYGDPSYRLHRDRSSRSGPDATTYHTAYELIAEVENLTASVQTKSHGLGGDDVESTEHGKRIAELFGRIPEGQRETWLDRADVAAAVGFAWGEGRVFGEAIKWLEKALHAETGDCPVRAIEQLGNFRVRSAGAQWRRIRETSPETEEELRQELIERIEGAIEDLAQITRRAPTIERLNLLGSAFKRLAWVREPGDQRLEALDKMAQYHGEAFETSGRSNAYSFTNGAAAKLLLLQLDKSLDGTCKDRLRDECNRIIDEARRDDENPSFENEVAVANCEVVMMLIQGSTRKDRTIATIGHYQSAFRRGASPREIASVREHLDFLIDLGDGLRKSQREALSDIRARILAISAK